MKPKGASCFVRRGFSHSVVRTTLILREIERCAKVPGRVPGGSEVSSVGRQVAADEGEEGQQDASRADGREHGEVEEQ